MGKKLKRKKTSRKRQAKTSTSKKRPIIILLAVLVAVGSYFFYFKGDRNPYAYRPDKTTLDIEALKGGETRPKRIMSPDKIGNCWTACTVTATAKKPSATKAF
jgi:hypothetical protein